METNKSELPEKIRNLDDEAWLKLLIQSINNRRIDDIDFPGFPPPDIQTRFVGNAYQQTLEEAFKFYKFVKSTAIKLEKPVIATAYSGNLDFMNENISCLVGYKLIPIEEGQYPFPDGQFGRIRIWIRLHISCRSFSMTTILGESWASWPVAIYVSISVIYLWVCATNSDWTSCDMQYFNQLRT